MPTLTSVIDTNIPNSLGSAGHVLTVNSGGNAAEWAAASGGASASDDLYIANPSSATNPTASGTNAVAIGDSSTAGGNYAAAIGSFSVAGGVNAFSGLGTANGNYAVALGVSSTANSERAVALGNSAVTAAVKAIAIGYHSSASATSAAAISRASASGADSFAAAIGTNNTGYGATATNSVSLGSYNKASGYQSAAVGGFGNVSNGNSSFVTGYQSYANGDFCFASGLYSKAAIYGTTAHASGYFSGIGDAQGCKYILRSDTTDATAEAMTTNNSTAGSTNQIVAATDTCITFSGTIVAMQNGAQSYGSWEIKGLLVNDGGTTTLANSAITVIQNASSWGLALSADNTNNALAITVTGEASHNIRWVANIQTAEVNYA